MQGGQSLADDCVVDPVALSGELNQSTHVDTRAAADGAVQNELARWLTKMTCDRPSNS